MTRPRAAALAALLITAAGALYAAVSAVARWEPSLGWLVQATIHLGELLAVVALAPAGAGGTSRAARIGLGAAGLGQATLAIAEVVYPHSPAVGDALFGVGPLLTGIGLIVAGVVVARRWGGPAWQRVAPLVLGIYIFVVMTPVLIGSGGPPAPAAVWAIAGWDVLWALVAASALSRLAPADAGGHRVVAELGP
ncbi:hypothetical protein [Cryptosporangium sp. NPDC051539]|uniref:hypothetical protein n=1 Tax=Cryptosporangium sp. NPDC051539 TaxID=3363962 RepID=UPI0037B01892